PLYAAIVFNGLYAEIRQLKTVRFVNATGNNAFDYIHLEAIARGSPTVQNLGLEARDCRFQMKERIQALHNRDVLDHQLGPTARELVRFNQLLLGALPGYAGAERSRHQSESFGPNCLNC